MNKNKFTYKFIFWLVAWIFLLSMFSAATALQPANTKNVSYKTETITFTPNAVSQINEYLTNFEECGCSQTSDTSYKVLELAEEENNEPSYNDGDCCCDDGCFYDNCRLDIDPIPEHRELVMGYYGIGYDNGTNSYLNGTNSNVLPLDFLGGNDGEDEEVKSFPLLAFMEGGDFENLRGEPHMLVFEKIFSNASYNTSETWDNQVTPDLKDVLDYKNKAVNLTVSVDDQTTLLAVIRIIYFGCMEKITANIYTSGFINETDQSIVPVRPYNESAIIYPWIVMEDFGEDTHPLPSDLYNFSVYMYEPTMMTVTGVYDTDPSFGNGTNILDTIDLNLGQINLTTTPVDLEIWVEMEIVFFGSCGCEPYEMLWSQFEGENGTIYTYETENGGDYIDLNQYPGYNPDMNLAIIGAWENSTFNYDVDYSPSMQLDTSILLDYNLSKGVINLTKSSSEPIALYFLIWQCCVCPTIEARIWIDGVISKDNQEDWTLNASNGIVEMPWGDDSFFYPRFLNQTGEMGKGSPVKFEIIGVWQNASYNFNEIPENQMGTNIFDEMLNQTHISLVNNTFDGQVLVLVVDIWWRDCKCENYFWEDKLNGQPIKVTEYNSKPVIDFNSYNYGFNEYQELYAVFLKNNFSDDGDFWDHAGNILDHMDYQENRAYLMIGTNIDVEVVIVILDTECRPPCNEAWIEWDADGTPFMASEFDGMIVLNFTFYDFYLDPRTKVVAVYNASTFDEHGDWFNQPDNFLQEMRYMENYAVLDANVSLSWELVVILEIDHCCWHTETWDWNGSENTPIYAENVNGQPAINMMEIGIHMGWNSFIVGIYNASEFDDHDMDRWNVPLHNFFMYFDMGYAFLDLDLSNVGVTEFVIIMAFNDCASCHEFQIWDNFENQSIVASYNGYDWIIDLDTYGFSFPVDTEIVGVFNQTGFNYDMELHKYWNEPGNYINFYDRNTNTIFLRNSEYYISNSQNLVIVIEINKCFSDCNEFRFEGQHYSIYGEVINGKFAVNLPNEGININPGERVVAVYVNSTFNWNDKDRIFGETNILDYYNEIEKVAYLTITTSESLVIIIHVDKCFNCHGFFTLDVNYPPAYDASGNLVLDLSNLGRHFGAEDKVWAIYPADEYRWDLPHDQQTGWNVLVHFDYQHYKAYLVKDNVLLQRNFVVVIEENNCICTSYHDPIFAGPNFPNDEVIIDVNNYNDFILHLPFNDSVEVFNGVYDFYLNQSKDNEIFVYENTFWNSWHDVKIKFSDYYSNLQIGDWFSLDISVFDECGNMGEISLTIKIKDVCSNNVTPQFGGNDNPNGTIFIVLPDKASSFEFMVPVQDQDSNSGHYDVFMNGTKVVSQHPWMNDIKVDFGGLGYTFNKTHVWKFEIVVYDMCGASFYLYFFITVDDEIPSPCENNKAPYIIEQLQEVYYIYDNFTDFYYQINVKDDEGLKNATYKVSVDGTVMAQGGLNDGLQMINISLKDYGINNFIAGDSYVIKIEIVDECGARAVYDFTVKVLAEGEPIPTDTNTSDTTTTKDDNLSTSPGFEFLFAIFVLIPVALASRRRRD